MRRYVAVFLALLLGVVSCNNLTPPSSPQKVYPPLVEKPIVRTIRNDTVMLQSPDNRGMVDIGTGVVFKRDGKSYIWTCAHLFENGAKRVVITDKRSGTTRPAYQFPIVRVLKKSIASDGSIVAVLDAQAVVMQCDFDQDLAVLECKNNVLADSTEFYLAPEIPPVGEKIYNIGNYKGTWGEYSYTEGVIAYLSRTFGKYHYCDQASMTIYHGSSGSGVFLEDGRCIGIVVMEADSGDSCAFYVPVRRIREWAKRQGIEYLLDPSLPVGK